MAESVSFDAPFVLKSSVILLYMRSLIYKGNVHHVTRFYTHLTSKGGSLTVLIPEQKPSGGANDKMIISLVTYYFLCMINNIVFRVKKMPQPKKWSRGSWFHL